MWEMGMGREEGGGGGRGRGGGMGRGEGGGGGRLLALPFTLPTRTSKSGAVKTTIYAVYGIYI